MKRCESMYGERYKCENCYSDINRQRGFKPKIHIWRCKSCGQQLVYKKSDDRYYNAYICYACNAVLNNQIDKYGSEFSTYEDKWKCRKCGCLLEVSEVEEYSRTEILDCIIDECSEKLLNDNIFFCKYCGAVLNQQVDYDPLIYDKEYSYLNYYCEKCGNEINKEDIKYTGREINNKYFCHRCGALLNVDSDFYDEDN